VTTTYRMPFGKHKGKPLSAIDGSYLLWLAELPDISARLLAAVQAELERRNADQTPLAIPDLRPIADSWRRQLAREFHPDHGGSNEAMRAVNRGYDLLLQLTEDIS